MLQPIVPEAYWIEYTDHTGYKLVNTAGFDEAALQADEGVPHSLDVRARYEDGVVSISVHANMPVRLHSCIVYLRHEFDPDERIVMNGYQSWTDTHELSPTSVMRGLRRVPAALVKRFVLEGSGDYRFVQYDEKRGHLHGFTYATFSKKRETTLLASLDESHGFTFLRTECENSAISAETECPIDVLNAGEEAELCRYLIATGAPDEVYDRWFDLMGVKPRPSRPLVGYTSWYRHYDDISEDKLLSDLEGAARVFDTIDTRGAERLFQIDDGWCKIGDWREIDTKKFPRGLRPIAEAIREKGFTPGLWLAPFVCEEDSRLFKMHPDWLARDHSGKPIPTGSHWSGHYALDTHVPACRDYIAESIRTAVEDWGFGFLKLDFLYAVCSQAHDGLNRGELMADGVDLLREAAGDACLIDGCGVPLAPAFGKFEYCRIGCDVGPDWKGPAIMRMLHRERVSVHNSLLNTRMRAPLDGRAFRNDPDVFFLRNDIKLALDQELLLLNSDADLATVLLTSDDMSTWGEAELDIYRKALDVMLPGE